ncbi:hypothetical protein [Saccharothrix variisporea]|uniref:Uncharacterized protein n=1 Tax=Saccharothrix variisporea TaxID=543527 RepID=A0A495XMA7_9PSEU|nr:hypothetical protein [Saccharothrix variisporea]RKT72738.1 hypothetical protein DFJ66_6062 [Saccharothrix variisporea]
MSYDLAVWEGDRPADDETAERTFLELFDRYIDTDVEHPPTERMERFEAALLGHWPGTSDPASDHSSPWSVLPFGGEARGPVVYLAMQYSRAVEAAEVIASLASSMGLVCFDPQTGELR